MSTDEIIEPENQEEELTDASDEQTPELEVTGHSNYKVPKIKDDAVKHHLSGMYQNWFGCRPLVRYSRHGPVRSALPVFFH